ncbi:MAG: 30S ribosomal protein S12 methylthiotransferase RimO [Candidatus Neomarinimicrobiota bacterium]
MKKDKKLNLISLGCAKNLVDSEVLLGALKNSAFEITDIPEDADTIVVNTCGFLDVAREESIETIFQAAQLKQKGKLRQLVVMGCLSERYPEEMSREIPEVDRFFGSNNQGQIMAFLTGQEHARDDPLYFRSILTPGHYAYLKIAEGCDMGCSFCSIPLMRGMQKSRTIESIVWEAEHLRDMGVRELLLIAQNSTSYGSDLKEKVNLSGLLKNLDGIGLDWIRLHYAHPATLNQELLHTMAQARNVCHYLDMPVQHVSDKILKSMRRGLGRKGIIKRIENLKKAIPDLHLRTTLIVGYPGETENDFMQLYDFVEEMRFDRLGIFIYSEEEGTPAADLKDNIPAEIKMERKLLITDLQAGISSEINSKKVGNIYKVIVDRANGDTAWGRTEYDSPDIDNTVKIRGRVKKGEFTKVLIKNFSEFELEGVVE